MKTTIVKSIAVGSNNSHIEMTNDGTKVYVSAHNSNSVFVIDSAANEVIGTIPVGRRPGGIAVSRNGNRLYFNRADVDPGVPGDPQCV